MRVPERALGEIARELANAVEGEVRFDLHNRQLYSTDASLYQVVPLGVVIPASVEDAVRAVEFCSKHSLPMLPRGGGTSLAGQCTNRAVVIDFSPNCHAVGAVDVAARTVRVEPGITVDDLNDRIAPTGLFFAPDPATSRHANVGGCIGNNAAGARSIRYGRTSENVVSIEGVLASGERVVFGPGAGRSGGEAGKLCRGVAEICRRYAPLIRERFPKTVRRNAGYGLDMIVKQLDAGVADDDLSLAPLLCGSEGTLAFTLGATLKLSVIPKAKGLAVLSFTSLDEAIAAVVPILKTRPSAVELLDDTIVDLARANAEYRKYVDLMPQPKGGALKAVLYVEYFAESDASEIAVSYERLKALVPGIASELHTQPAAMLNAWKLRKAGEPLLHGVTGNRKPITFVEDNAVPVERLSEFVREFRRIVAEHGTVAAYYAHASVGVLHVRPLIDLHDAADRERMRSIAVKVADLAKSLGGVMSGEHGDGRVRGPLLERYFGPELMAAFREVKRLFDPRELLNPGNVVSLDGSLRPIESMTTRLRIKPGERDDAPIVEVPDTRTFFAYADQHGFASAVEMCNGAGVCRKKQGGTMCPSYQATLDERHSTRGRGNALRMAITGQAIGGDASTAGGPPVWDDAGAIETLNLCLSCKACKTECPSNVDISRLKAEYTAQRYREKGVPFGAMAFGHVRELNLLGSMLAPLANAGNGSAIGKWVFEKVLGVDRRRALPRFERSLAKQWSATGAGTARVALFGDCFTMYNETRIGLAAKRVLEACGYDVVLADAGCCGRALISTGLLGSAVETIDATLARLMPLIENDGVMAILFAEPSCLSAVKDDWLDLKVATPRKVREKLAAKAFLVEDFVERAWGSHPARAEFRAVDGEVLLHGHCHQKALWGVDTSAKLLKRVAGDKLRVLDTGCCGMAGSFGYTKDRYDLSMKIGGLTLFPTVRGAEGAVVIAPGTSCRHQIHDGTGKDAVHPVEWVAGMMK